MTTARPTYAIDANVILRYLVHDDDKLAAKAVTIMEAVDDGKISVVCDPVTLAEVVWVLSSHYGLPPTRVADGLGPILKADHFLMENKSRYVRAMDLFADCVPHFGDACACAAALEKADGALLSFDRRLSRVEGVKRRESD